MSLQEFVARVLVEALTTVGIFFPALALGVGLTIWLHDWTDEPGTDSTGPK